jgi:mono/diheme cytochrome c family protein
MRARSRGARAAPRTRMLLVVGLSAVAIAGCGSAAPKSATTSAASGHGDLNRLAHRCNEPERTMVEQLDAALKTLDIQGLHGSRAELTEALDTLATYAATRHPPVNCTKLLAAFVATFSERARHTTSTERERRGLFSGGPTELAIEPPTAVAREGGARLAEFKLGRVVTAQSGCLACHRIGDNGNSGPGPDLTQVGLRLSSQQIERALVSPTAPMPSFKRLPRMKFKAIVQFLALLGQ